MYRQDRTFALNLEALDDRLVPSVVDLTTRGAEAAVGGGIVRQIDARPINPNQVQPVVRLDANGVEEATSRRPVTVGQLPRQTVNGVDYRELRLNVDETKKSPTLSVDSVQLFLGSGPAPVFDLDASGDTSVLLDDRLNASGRADDLALLVPEAAFAGATAETRVVLYSKMGVVAAASGGFEEWSVVGRGGGAPIVPPPPPPPAEELSTLSGFAYQDVDRSEDLSDRDRRLKGAVIELRGTDYLGNAVSLTTTTAADGSYSFADVRRGTYTLAGHDAGGYEGYDDFNQAGSVGGSPSDPWDETRPDVIAGIELGAGVHGTDYNFGEQAPMLG